jgi:hypothetical protein
VSARGVPGEEGEVGGMAIREKLLLDMARRFGPVIDQVESVGRACILARVWLAEMVEAGHGSPAEIRHELGTLLERGYLATSLGDYIGLTAKGLVAARVLEPGIGTPKRLRLVLPNRKRTPRFAAKFETGDDVLDGQLNRGGVVLACFYLLVAEQPERDYVLTLQWLVDNLPHLAALGIGPKYGRGDRITTTAETVSGAMELLGRVLPLQVTKDAADARQTAWFLNGPLPAVDIVGPAWRGDELRWRHLWQLLTQELSERRRMPSGTALGAESKPPPNETSER